MKELIEKGIRAAKLDGGVYREAYEGEGVNIFLALSLVILSAGAAGIAGLPFRGVVGILANILNTCIRWLIWTGIIYLLAGKVFKLKSDLEFKGLLRATGLSAAPGAIRILGAVPVLYSPVFIIGGVWLATALVMAATYSMEEASLWKTASVTLFSWVLMAAGYIFSSMFLRGALFRR